MTSGGSADVTVHGCLATSTQNSGIQDIAANTEPCSLASWRDSKFPNSGKGSLMQTLRHLATVLLGGLLLIVEPAVAATRTVHLQLRNSGSRELIHSIYSKTTWCR